MAPSCRKRVKRRVSVWGERLKENLHAWGLGGGGCTCAECMCLWRTGVRGGCRGGWVQCMCVRVYVVCDGGVTSDSIAVSRPHNTR